MRSKIMSYFFKPVEPSKLVKLLIMGAPGSGKGTITKKIQKLIPNIHVLSSGDLFRKHIIEKTAIGKEVTQILASGNLVPDDLTNSLILQELKKMNHKSWILDGYPRTLNQAKLLDKLLGPSEPLNLVINLNIHSHVILNRISQRYIHPPSGRTYNLSYNPPVKAGFDDVTGEVLEKRSDDDKATVEKRLDAYKSSTEPLLSYYKKDKLVEFDGDTSDEIYPKLEKVLFERFPWIKSGK